jgi:hypothetical protein
MLTMYLKKSRNDAEDRRIGPVDALRIVRKSLRVLPLDVEILRLNGDRWLCDDESFAALVIEAPTLIYAERFRHRKGKFYGPFDHIRLQHGVIRAGRGGRITLAGFNVFDAAWHFFGDGTDWTTVIFYPCDR